jgi:predicted  nucleic acid-binding Zn-ribbon protein
MKSQSEQLLAVQAKLKDSQVALAEVQGRELPMQYDLLKAQREVENLQARLRLAEAEAASRASDLQAERTSSSAARLELSQKLEAASYNAESLDAKLKAAVVINYLLIEIFGLYFYVICIYGIFCTLSNPATLWMRSTRTA